MSLCRDHESQPTYTRLKHIACMVYLKLKVGYVWIKSFGNEGDMCALFHHVWLYCRALTCNDFCAKP